MLHLVLASPKSNASPSSLSVCVVVCDVSVSVSACAVCVRERVCGQFQV